MPQSNLIPFPKGQRAAPSAYTALAKAPFAALIFEPDDQLTLLWRNAQHERMSRSEGRDVAGMGMFDAFPPAEAEDATAARQAIHEAVARIIKSGYPEEIGPYRYDLRVGDGFAEHHWRMELTPIFEGEVITSILQTAHDVTGEVLGRRLASTYQRASMQTAAVSYFSYDPKSDLFDRADQIDTMFGFEHGEAGAYAKPFFERVHPDDVATVHVEVGRVFDAPRGDTAKFDYRVLLPCGEQRHIRIRAGVVTDPADRREKLVGTFVDITDDERRRYRLERALEQRSEVIREANHRINNSLQIATTMLIMEAHALAASSDSSVQDAVTIMERVADRIRALADIHGLLQFSDDAKTVFLDEVVAQLVDLVRQSFGLSDERVSFSTQGELITVPSDVAINIALIVNEFLMNAAKYGIPKDGSVAVINVSLIRELHGVRVKVENPIITRDKALSRLPCSGLGTRLIEAFAGRIGAKLEQQSEGRRFVAGVFLPIG